MSKQHNTDLERILIVPDVHIPYHDVRAWDLMVKVAKDFEPSHIVVLGDFADFYAVSSFGKDPTRANQLDVEIAECNKALDQLDLIGARHKYFISGNHEQRLERYLQDKSPALFSMLKVESLFKLKQRGWHFTPYREDVKIGKVYFTHDVGQGGRTAAHKTMDTYQHSIITGHSHRMAYVVESNATGTSMLSAQFGWLGDVKQCDYLHRIKAQKDWALGFGLGYIRSNGVMHLNPVPIVEYACVVNGKLFTS